MATQRIVMKLALTEEEHALLKAEAARLHISMSALIKLRVFAREEQR